MRWPPSEKPARLRGSLHLIGPALAGIIEAHFLQPSDAVVGVGPPVAPAHGVEIARAFVGRTHTGANRIRLPATAWPGFAPKALIASEGRHRTARIAELHCKGFRCGSGNSRQSEDQYERAQWGTSLEFRSTIMNRVSTAIGELPATMINPDEQKKARAEARGVLAESMKGPKKILEKPSLDNEKKPKELRKLMAESESIDVETDGKRMANDEKQLALVEKKLSLVLQAQHYAQTGTPEVFSKH